MGRRFRVSKIQEDHPNTVSFFWKKITITMSIETLEYRLVSKEESFEIRTYSNMIIATTKVQSDYKSSTSAGFKRIFNYIVGGNDKEAKIAMTTPVISDCPSEDLRVYNISFVMPKKYSMEDLPKANTSLVSIKQKSLGDVAVLTFGGWANESRSINYKKKLALLLEKKSIKTQGGFMIARFNSPLALMFRKNEVMVRIIS